MLTILKHNRLKHVHTRLSAERVCTLDELASELDISGKTVQRLLNDLRDLYGAEIRYSKRDGYTYTRPPVDFDNSLSGVQTTEPDRVHLGLGVKALEYLNLKQPAKELRKWLRNISGESLDLPLKELDRVISFTDLQQGLSLDTDIRELLLAIQRKKVVQFRYKNRQRGRPGMRKVNPYHLAYRESAWYLIGFAHDHKSIRTYSLSRMAGIKICEEQFTDPRFDPESYFRDGGIVQSGADAMEVHLIYSPSITNVVMERQYQFDFIENPKCDGEGRLHMRFRHFNVDWLISFIMGFGPDVEVKGPRKLKTAVKDRLQSTLDCHYS